MSTIIGLSDQVRMPRLGKIRIGIKVGPEGKQYPKAVDYFVVPPEVQEVYGEKPTSLRVMLPSNEISDNFPQALKQYGLSQGLICKGDGERAMRVDESTGEIVPIPCPYKDCEHYGTRIVKGKEKPGDCKAIGTLSFLLPDVPGFGVWQISTSSFNSIVNLNSEMKLAQKILGGRLAGIPFILTNEEQISQHKGKKVKIRVLHLRNDITLGQLRALPGFDSIPAAALPAPDDTLDDLYDSESEQADLSPEESPTPTPCDENPVAEPVREIVCSKCGVAVNAAVKIFSQHTFGMILCPTCNPD